VTLCDREKGGYLKGDITHIENHIQILGSVNCKKSITDSVSACSDKLQSPIFKGIRIPALRQSRMKVKNVTTLQLSPPQFDVSFPEKLLKIVASKSEIFSLKFGNMLPYELEEVMGCDVIIGGSAKRDNV